MKVQGSARSLLTSLVGNLRDRNGSLPCSLVAGGHGSGTVWGGWASAVCEESGRPSRRCWILTRGWARLARGRGGQGASVQVQSGRAWLGLRSAAAAGVAELSVLAQSWRTPRGVEAGAATQGKAVELNPNYRDSHSSEIRGVERRQ